MILVKRTLMMAIIMVSSNAASMVASSCDYKLLSKCIDSLADTFAFAGALMKPVGDSDLTRACSKLDATCKCALLAGCEDDDVISIEGGWTGIKESLTYLCSQEGRQGLAKFQTCLTTAKKGTYYDQLIGCLIGIDEKLSKSDSCNAQLACYAVAARDNCDCSGFAVNYYIKYYQPITKYESGCEYSSYKTNN